MAKIHPGPLLASASGSLGELTFRQTRQGLVVQQKSHPSPRQTPAGDFTKEAFRVAMILFKFLNPDLRIRVGYASSVSGQTVMQAWVGAYYRLYRYQTWNMPLSDGKTPPLLLLGTITTGDSIAFVTNLDTPGGNYHANIMQTFVDNWAGTTPDLEDYPLTVPPATLPFNPILPALTYLLFPFLPGDPLSLGKSDAHIGFFP